MTVQNERSARSCEVKIASISPLVRLILFPTATRPMVTDRSSSCKVVLHYKNVRLKSLTLLSLSWESALSQTRRKSSTDSAPQKYENSTFVQSKSFILARPRSLLRAHCFHGGRNGVRRGKTIRPVMGEIGQQRARSINPAKIALQLFRNKLAMPGPEREGGPTAAAEEDYANRAYPARMSRSALTRNASRLGPMSWQELQQRYLNALGAALDARGSEHGQFSRCPDFQRRSLHDFWSDHRAWH